MYKKLLFIFLILTVVSFGQSVPKSPFSNSLWLGLEGGATLPQTDYKDIVPNYFGRVTAEYFLESWDFGSLGFVGFGGMGKVSGEDDRKIPSKLAADVTEYGGGVKFVFNVSESVYPYLLVSGANITYKVKDDATGNELNKVITIGNDNDHSLRIGGEVGAKFPLSDMFALKVSASMYATSEDWLDDYWNDVNKDWYATVGAGVMVKLFGGVKDTDMDGVPDDLDKCPNTPLGLKVDIDGCSVDSDGDGIVDEEELALGTDMNNPDTDGDGLKDGEEVRNYKTNPLKDDTDGDGLKDGDEVIKHKTDPLKADTDGDGLSDFDEITKYKTSPVKKDTDADDLMDGEEVNTYKTDPLKADTDADGLKDNLEVKQYKTNPLKADTDGGSILDGAEILRSTNPLDPKDDVESIKSEVGQAIVLEGVVFATGKSDILPESEAILTKAYYTLKDNPEIHVQIQGHTDNVGNKRKNMELSLARAESVKAFLIAKGIDGARITTAGFGPDKPLVPNTTAANKQKNRRIEFLRTK